MLKVHDSVAQPWGVAALLTCAAVPTVLLAGWAGRLVDSHDSRRLAVLSAAWQAVCCLALALAGPLWVTCALVVLLQAGNSVSGPTWQVLVPRMVGEDETAAAVGAVQSLTTGAAVAGSPIAGFLVQGLGTGAPLVIDAATFVALAIAGAVVRTRRRPERRSGPARRRVLVALAPNEGLRSLRADSVLLPLMLGMFAFTVFGEGTNVVEVFLVRDSLGGSSLSYGLVGGATSAGIVVGSMCSGQVRDQGRHVLVAVSGTAVMATAVVAAGLAPTITVLAGALALLGVANGAVNASTMTLLLTRTPEQLRGRTVAAVTGVGRACSVIAMALGGLCGAVLGPRPTFVGSGVLSLMVAGWLALRMRRWSRLRSRGRIGGEDPSLVDVDGHLRE